MNKPDGRLDTTAASMLLAVLVLTPWPLGSRLPWAGMLAATVIISLGAVWLATKLVSGAPLPDGSILMPIVAFLAWTGFQWAADTTIYKHATAFEWTRVLSYALTFVIALHLSRSPRHAKRFHIALIAAGLIVGIFALVQHLAWNGRLFWFYDPPYQGMRFGPFNNRNYFAGYMVATLPVAFAAALYDTLERGRVFLWYGLGLAVLALMMSLSRGGTLSLAAAFGLVLALYSSSTLRSTHDSRPLQTKQLPRWIQATALIASAGIVLAFGLAFLGQADTVLSRMESVLDLRPAESGAGRITIWRETIPMLWDRPIMGFGLNTYLWAFPAYRTTPTSLFETNAHNEYLEMVVETGVVGAAICAWFLFALLRSSFLRLRNAAGPIDAGIRAGSLAAWVGTLVYGLSDFPTIIPAIDYALAVSAALLLSDT